MQTVQTPQSRESLEPTREQHHTVQLQQETIDRLDALREAGQSHDELVNELIDIYQATEWSMHTVETRCKPLPNRPASTAETSLLCTKR